MRNILGINNIPRIKWKPNYAIECEKFKALNFKYIHFHDAALENPGSQLIDIHRIFPLFHLDDTKEENYFFAQTDDYLRFLKDSDAEIDFKLGESIDHSGGSHFVQVPSDIDKWARICRNIIAHYKNGAMNGMYLNIKRVTVWEEPDNKVLLCGSVEDYAKMFVVVYKLLKKEFPDIKIGGPCCCIDVEKGYSGTPMFIEDFLRICKENGVVPDYLITTMYMRNLEGDFSWQDFLPRGKELMEKYGFSEYKYSLGEWHLGPKNNNWHHHDTNGFTTSENAAYSVSLLIDLMDVDFLETAYYYAWGSGQWAVDDYRAEEYTLMPVYYGLMFFQRLATECTERLAISSENPKIRTLAGKTHNGKIRVLVSCYQTEDCVINIDTCGTDKATLKSITESYNEDDCITGKEIFSKDGIFEIRHFGTNSVYLLEFDA